MNQKQMNEAIQKHRDMVVQLTDMSVVRERLTHLAKNPSEAIILEQNLIAIGFICSVMGDEKGRQSILDASSAVSMFVVCGKEAIRQMEAQT